MTCFLFNLLCFQLLLLGLLDLNSVTCNWNSVFFFLLCHGRINVSFVEDNMDLFLLCILLLIINMPSKVGFLNLFMTNLEHTYFYELSFVVCYECLLIRLFS